MSPDTERWIDKVQKLLAKAERTDSQAEADAFSVKAEELMIQHAIDEDMLRVHRGVQRDEIGKKSIHFTGIFAGQWRELACLIGGAIGFKSVYYNPWDKPGVQITWVGFKSELDDAEVLLASLQLQIARLMPHAVKAYEDGRGWPMAKQEKYVWRRSFITMFSLTVQARLEETRRQVVTEYDSDGSLLPVLADKATLVEQVYEEMFPDLGNARVSKRRYDSSGGTAGRKAGETADINSRKIGHRKAIGQ